MKGHRFVKEKHIEWISFYSTKTHWEDIFSFNRYIDRTSLINNDTMRRHHFVWQRYITRILFSSTKTHWDEICGVRLKNFTSFSKLHIVCPVTETQRNIMLVQNMCNVYKDIFQQSLETVLCNIKGSIDNTDVKYLSDVLKLVSLISSFLHIRLQSI